MNEWIEVYFWAVVYVAIAVLIIALFLRGTGRDFEKWLREWEAEDRARDTAVKLQCLRAMQGRGSPTDGSESYWAAHRVSAEASTDVGAK